METSPAADWGILDQETVAVDEKEQQAGVKSGLIPAVGF